jgi:hypothetical protein
MLPVTQVPALVLQPSLLGEGAASLAHREMLAEAATPTIPEVGMAVGVAVGAVWPSVRATVSNGSARPTATKSGVNAVAINNTSPSPSRVANRQITRFVRTPNLSRGHTATRVPPVVANPREYVQFLSVTC